MFNLILCEGSGNENGSETQQWEQSSRIDEILVLTLLAENVFLYLFYELRYYEFYILPKEHIIEVIMHSNP